MEVWRQDMFREVLQSLLCSFTHPCHWRQSLYPPTPLAFWPVEGIGAYAMHK